MASKKAQPWKPGQSGNPKGRPKGIVDKRAALRKALGDELPAIVAAVVKAAKGGDVQAASLILSRAMPPLRPSREPIVLEGVPERGTAVELAQALVVAAARGKLPTDAAADLIGAIAATSRIIEVEELARRITALEVQRGNA